jgi:hypothetical protein
LVALAMARVMDFWLLHKHPEHVDES